MNKNFHLVINPGRYPHYAKQLKKLMKYVPQGTIHESQSAEHFRELIKEFVHSEDSYLLVWGGDGTANLALNTLMNQSDKKRRKTMAVGFLRGGSGNGIQDSYEVPKSLTGQVKTYLKSMENGYTQRVDLLKVGFNGQTQFGQLFGSGIDSQILSARNKLTRAGGDRAPRPGLFPYLFPIFRIVRRGIHLLSQPQIISMKNGRFAFRGTGTNAEFPFKEYRLETHAPMIEAGVRPYYGWSYRICPDVVCNDGFFDTYLFNVTSRMSVFANLFYFWNGHYHRINKRWAKKGHPLIEHYKVKEMTLEPKEDRLFHIDGELYHSSGEITLGVKHRALKFIVPESFHEKFHPIHEWHKKIK